MPRGSGSRMAAPRPRATPTLSNGRVYTARRDGDPQRARARTGGGGCSRNAATDTGAQNPGWGFAGRPWSWADLVIVPASSFRLAAY